METKIFCHELIRGSETQMINTKDGLYNLTQVKSTKYQILYVRKTYSIVKKASIIPGKSDMCSQNISSLSINSVTESMKTCA